MIEALLEIFLEVVCYAVGAVVLPVVTMGKCYAAKVWKDKQNLSDYKWHGVRKDPQGRYEVSEPTTQFVGFITIFGGIALLLFCAFKIA